MTPAAGAEKVSAGFPWSRAFCAVALFCTFLAAAARAQAAHASEYELKAAFLFNFAKFVEWPQDSGEQRFVFCVSGDAALEDAVEQLLLGRKLGDREVSVRRITDARGTAGCNLLFVDRGEAQRMGAALEALRGRSILTVGDGEEFCRAGGVIAFVLEENHMHFVINPDAAVRARLKISSRLLALARIVHPPRSAHGE